MDTGEFNSIVTVGKSCKCFGFCKEFNSRFFFLVSYRLVIILCLEGDYWTPASLKTLFDERGGKLNFFVEESA
jgi:hypothetical protein